MKRAMSTVKNIAAAAMTLAVFFGFAGFKPVTANAAQAAMPATASVEEENSYFEEDAYQRSFLTLINNERAQAGLSPSARTTWPAAPPPIPQWISGWLPTSPASVS